jgi:hypothetical protein
MWLIKGIFLGFGLFVGGLFLLAVLSVLSAVVRGTVQHGQAIGLSAVFAATIWNPFWYLGLVGCILVGVSIVGSRGTPVP